MNIRALMTAVVVMGVLIVAGVTILVVTAFRRLSLPPISSAQLLDEPQGTHMQSVSAVGDRLAVLLLGGGPDRIVLLDARSGKVVGRIGLVAER